MGGFGLHNILPALRVKVTALHQHNDKLYIGTATGAVQVYTFLAGQGSNGLPKLEWIKTYNLAKRQIDQIGVLPNAGYLLVLADAAVSAYNLNDLSAKPRPISQARNVHSFAVASYDPSKTKGKGKSSVDSEQAAELVDFLIIGCRKKIVVYPRVNAGFKALECWEQALPHSPRQVLLPPTTNRTLPETAHLLYSPTSSVILHLSPSAPNLTITELPNIPPPPPISDEEDGAILQASGGVEKEASATGSGLGIGLGGLGGYVGLGSKAVSPVGTAVSNGEVMMAREDLGVFVSTDGSYSRSNSLKWSNPPDSAVYANPFIYSAMPAASASASASTAPPPQPSIHVHLGPSLHIRHALPMPHPPTGSFTLSCLSPITKLSGTPANSVDASTPLLFVASPTDRGLSQAEGCSVWAVQAASLADEVAELVRDGRMTDAIGLVESVGETGFAPNGRLPHLKTLAAVSDFSFGHYQSAMDQFLTYNINPALVISLYPAETIAGRLHMPRDQWMELFGAESGSRLQPEVRKLASAEEVVGGKGVLKSVAAVAGLGLVKKGSVDSLRAAVAAGQAGKAGSAQVEVVEGQKEEAENMSEKVEKAPTMNDHEIPRAATEALMYYLSDRRQKLTGAINQLSSEHPLPSEDSLPPLSSLSASELHRLPNVPLTELEPEQLLRTAQVIYTALLKVYLVARPTLVGSLCRIENWCDVEEVEELLKAQKYTDLIDLYQGKKMHAKALKMLHELAQDEEDRLDRYPPTVRYLQKLGPEYMDTILESSKWVLQEDSKMGVQIFTADEATVESWPRQRVVQFLDKQHQPSCEAYLEHIIDELKEEGAEYHEKLAELYISDAKADATDGSAAYDRLVTFLGRSTRYRANRLVSRIPKDSMPLAQAILLGRMARHDEALRIYIYRLKDYAAAERHCSAVYAQASAEADSTVQPADRSDIFLVLLRLYLQPSKSDPVLLEPALELIGHQGARLDAEKVIALLPPLVTMKDVQDFFVKSLRDGYARRNERKIVTGIASARKEQVERMLMGLQEKRVRITDQRIVINGLDSLRSLYTHLEVKLPIFTVKTASVPILPMCEDEIAQETISEESLAIFGQ